MNSLLGSFGNVFKNTSKINQFQKTPQQPNILMQAIGAALRGESPQQFMQNLAQTHPQLRQYDLSNLQDTAQQICQQKGVDINQTINQIDDITSNILQSSR